MHPHFLNQVDAEQMAFFESLLLGRIESKVVSTRVGKGCLEVMIGMLRRGQPCRRNFRIYRGFHGVHLVPRMARNRRACQFVGFQTAVSRPSKHGSGLVCGNPRCKSRPSAPSVGGMVG